MGSRPQSPRQLPHLCLFMLLVSLLPGLVHACDIDWGDGALYFYERTPESNAGSVLIGGCTGNPFIFHSYGSTVQEIKAWAEGDLIRGIWFDLFNGEAFTIGEMPARDPTASFIFEVGETLLGSYVLTGNNIDTRLGHLSFKTSKGRSFSVGEAKTNYVFDSQDSYLTGFFGLEGRDVDILGFILMKKIEEETITDVSYDLPKGILPQKPEQLHSKSFTNPHQVEDKIIITLSREVSTTKEWSLEKGMSHTASVTVEAEVPLVKIAPTVTIGYEFSTSQTSRHTSTNFVSTRVEQTVEITVPACSFGEVTVAYYESSEDINFNGKQRIKFVEEKDSLVLDINGVYQGVASTTQFVNKCGILYYTTGVCNGTVASDSAAVCDGTASAPTSSATTSAAPTSSPEMDGPAAPSSGQTPFIAVSWQSSSTIIVVVTGAVLLMLR